MTQSSKNPVELDFSGVDICVRNNLVEPDVKINQAMKAVGDMLDGKKLHVLGGNVKKTNSAFCP